MYWVFCLAGPFYITVTDGTVSEALSLFSNEKLDTSKFKTIEETFDELEDLLRGGAEVHPAWRFDDIQGVPDELIVFKYGEGKELLNEYNYRIVVRMPKEFHMQRLGAAKAAFGAKDIENYSFIFQRYFMKMPDVAVFKCIYCSAAVLSYRLCLWGTSNLSL